LLQCNINHEGNLVMNTLKFVITCAVLLSAAAAQAGSPFSHPAIARAELADNASRQASDASPVLVGHPASPRWVVKHANHEHPAVQVRAAASTGIDANAFLVQPPASTTWTVAAAPIELPVLARQ
jgi:hypothetical protein